MKLIMDDNFALGKDFIFKEPEKIQKNKSQEI